MSNSKRVVLLSLVGVLTSLPMLVSAETVFEEVSVTYDGGGQDPVNAAAVDIDGNMYITGGRSDSAGVRTYYTAKYDSYGREKWVQNYSTGQASWFAPFDTMTVDRASNTYVALSESYNFGKVLKYDAAGNETVLVEGSVTPYNYDHRVGLVLDKDETNLYLRASNSIKKISLDGGAGWTQPLYNANTWVRDIAVDDAGNVYAVGRSIYLSGNGTTDVVVKKFDSNGNELWVRHWYEEGKQNEDAHGLEIDSNGNVYILVQTINYENSCLYCITSSIVSFSSSSGALIGNAVLNGTDGYLAGAIRVADDKIYVTMRRKTTNVLITQKLNTDLSLVWSTEYSGGTSTPRGLDVDGTGNVVVGIRTQYNMATVKFDMYGTELWTQAGDGNDSAFVKFGTTGEIYAAGSTVDAFMYRYGVTQLICQ